MQALWAGTFVEEANLTVSISLLRRILGEKDGNVRYIETVPKKGYRFIAPVREGMCPDAGMPETDPSSDAPIAQAQPIWTDSTSAVVPPEAARGEQNSRGSLHSASHTARFSTRSHNISIFAVTIQRILFATFVYIAHGKPAASSENVIWYVVRRCAERMQLDHLAPHDLRTCGKLCHVNGGELEQIQFLLGHVSVLTTERYLACKQNLEEPVNDRF